MINLIDFDVPTLDFKDVYLESETVDKYLYEDICRKTKIEFTVLSREEVYNHINNEIKQFSNLINIPYKETRGILIKNCWKIENLFDQKLKGKNMNDLTFEIHQVIKCEEICDSCLIKNIVAISSCGYRICKVCLIKIIDLKYEALDKPDENFIETIDDNCIISAAEELGLKNESNLALFINYSYNNGKYAKCPNNFCKWIIKVHQIKPMTIECNCGCNYCFLCLDHSHPPISCKLLKLWRKQIRKSRMNGELNLTLYKKCPDCHLSVSKEGASNHIICPNINCNATFCWLCFESRAKHKINQECACYKSKKIEESEIFEFYASRYLECQKSLMSIYQYSDFILSTINSSGIQNLKTNFISVVKNLMSSLIECQNTLIYSMILLNSLYENAIWHNLIILSNNLAISIDHVCYFIEFEYPLSHMANEILIETLTFKISSCKNRKDELVSKFNKEIDSG